MKVSVCLLVMAGASTLATNVGLAEQAATVAAAKTPAHVRGAKQGAVPNKGNAEVPHGVASAALVNSSVKHAKNVKSNVAGPQGLIPTAPGGSVEINRNLQRNAVGSQGVGPTASFGAQKNSATINGSGMTSKGRPVNTGTLTGGVAKNSATVNGTGMRSRN
jgi:hypothetical protein